MQKNKSNITPVFYLGAARNGTTWLGNILHEVFGISTAFHPLHYGINESAINKNNKYWGDLSNNDNYIKFIELYSKSDFFLLVDGDKEYFYRNPQDNFFEFFLTLMDQYAIKNNKTNWCTKLDPDFYENLSDLDYFINLINKRYEQVKYIGIQRAHSQYLKSYVHMSGRFHTLRSKLKPLAYILGSARYHLYYRSISNIIKDQNAILIKYEDLKQNYKDEIENISTYLNIKQLKNEVTSQKNSSFKKTDSKNISSLATVIHKVLSKSFYVNYLILKFYSKIVNKDPQLYYRILKSKYFQDRLITDLEKTHDFQIIDLIKSKKDLIN